MSKHVAGNRRAFTLIELLVVIAVVSIIAAILFPVFAKVREKGRQTACAGNEKQMGLAILAYAQDNDECLPNRSSVAQDYSWKFEIYPYIKSTRIYQCPSNPSRELDDYNTATGLVNDDAPDFLASYAANRGSGNDGPFIDPHPNAPPPDNQLLTVKLSGLESPSQTIGIVETTSQYTDFVVTNLRWAKPNAHDAELGGNVFSGHLGRSNFQFMDGHVKAMKPLATLDLADGGSGSVNMWTRDNKAFTDASPPPAVGDATGKTVLAYSEALYH